MTECKSDRIQSWNVPPISTLYPEISDIHVFYNSSGSNLGYVAYNPNSDLVFMSFAGTHDLENWLQDFDFFKINYARCDGCEVHGGFVGAYENLKDDIIGSYMSLVQKYSTARRAIIGHSLGAGMATLALLDLSETIEIDDFYTFGSPRVGNQNFADYFNQKNPKTLKVRITHNRDAVPHLPFDFLGFRHIDREVFYIEDSSQFIICGNNIEDKSCSLQYQIYQVDPSDHTTYMGFDLNPVKQSCK